MYPLVRELAAAGAPIRVPVTVTCRVLKLPRQHYYRWLAHPVTDAELEEAYRAHALFVAHDDDPEFGYRFLVDEARQAGEPMAARTAWRICSENGWWSAFGKPKARGHGKKPGPPVHDDLCAVVDEHGVVRHRFNATAPNDLWLTDITEHRTSEGKLYLCAVKDAYSNRIVGYSISDRMKSRLAVDALASAVARRRVEGADVAGCIVHSDRGSQGEFNRSSQHLEFGGVHQWQLGTGARRPVMRRRSFVGSGVRIGRCGRRCVRRGGPIPHGPCSASSGG
tara:strand:+ start:363 stop:1202 length:840 start_codon:yes stop_codon:yes gene_type:complete